MNDLDVIQCWAMRPLWMRRGAELMKSGSEMGEFLFLRVERPGIKDHGLVLEQ